MTMQLTDEQVETYRHDGVLPLGEVLDTEVVEVAREHLDQLREDEHIDNPSEASGKDTFRRLEVSRVDPWFMSLVTRDSIVGPATSILGPNVQYFQDNVFWKPANTGAPSPWHQDQTWWKANPPNMATIWIALDDTDDDNGAVQYIPGSHHHFIDPPKAEDGGDGVVLDPDKIDRSGAVSFNLPAGHAVMHHCLTVHGAPPNDSNRPRRGYSVHLQQAGLLGQSAEHSPLLAGEMPAE